MIELKKILTTVLLRGRVGVGVWTEAFRGLINFNDQLTLCHV